MAKKQYKIPETIIVASYTVTHLLKADSGNGNGEAKRNFNFGDNWEESSDDGDSQWPKQKSLWDD